MNKEEIEKMTQEERIRQLEWSDPYEFSYSYAYYLLDYINHLETNIEEALKTTKELYEEGVEWHWDNSVLETYVLDLLSILERGKEC
jgi:hypothetical protein